MPLGKNRRRLLQQFLTSVLSFCAAYMNHNASYTSHIAHNDRTLVMHLPTRPVCVRIHTCGFACWKHNGLQAETRHLYGSHHPSQQKNEDAEALPVRYSLASQLQAGETKYSRSHLSRHIVLKSYIWPEHCQILLGSHTIAGLCLFFVLKPPYIFTHGL